MKVTTMSRSLVVWSVFLVTFVEASILHRSIRSARCTPLDPTTDSILHRDSHPDCRPKPFPDYFSRCTCTYFVARKEDGCPSNYYALCKKIEDPSIKSPQVVKRVQEPQDAEVWQQRPLTAESVKEPPKKIIKAVPQPPQVSPPPIDREEGTTASSLSITQAGKLSRAENVAHKLVFKPIPLAFANIAIGIEAKPRSPIFAPQLAVTQAPVVDPETFAPPPRSSPPRSPRTDGEQVDRPDQCPEELSGCIFDDEVEGTDCTTFGNRACQAVGADYCSAAIGTPLRRVCCKVSGVQRAKQDDNGIGCPSSNGGCIFADRVQGTDCTVNGSVDCLADGADYCGAVVDGRRVCCSSNRDPPPKFLGDGSETCPEQNSGCIFDDFANGIDCSEEGNTKCATFGSQYYCSAWFGFPLKRGCCTIIRPARNLTQSDTAQACPPANSGCIFDDVVTGTDCTLAGNAACNATGSYCSAYFDRPSRRVCCTTRQ